VKIARLEDRLDGFVGPEHKPPIIREMAHHHHIFAEFRRDSGGRSAFPVILPRALSGTIRKPSQ
jgi:hypothetical protein